METYELDITAEKCPMTFVKTKIALNNMQQGDVLNVRLREGEPLENVPRSASEQGFNVLSITETSTKGIYIIKIEK